MPEEIVTGTPAATATPTPVPAGEGTPTPTPTPAPAGTTAGSEWEREKRGLIGETQKERAARQKLEGEFNTLKAQNEINLKRINALAGINPKSSDEAADEEIRAAFATKFPDLASLTADDIKAIREMRAQTTQLKSSSDAMWKRHTNQVLSSLNTSVAEKLGGGDLSPKQKETLRREYIAYIEAGQAEGKDLISRHEAADETLIEEFVESYLKEWQEPIRRSVTSTEINRNRALPIGKGRTITTVVPKKIDFSNSKAVEDAAVESFLSNGGAFDK